MTISTKRTFTAVGRPIGRIDGVAKVTGGTKYAYDIHIRGMLHAKVLRSPLGHARIKRIDTSKARAYPGVHSVFTAADLSKELDTNPNERVLTVLAGEEVLYYGQPIAAVLAESPSVAEEAVDLIEMELEELTAVVDPLRAMEPGSPLVRAAVGEVDRSEEQAHITISTDAAKEQTGSTNVTQRVSYTRGDVEKGFAEADVVVERRWHASWVHQGYIENHVAVVDCDVNGDYTVWTGTQGTFRVREELARLLQVPEGKINVEVVEMGGGFGGKNRPFDSALAAALAHEVRRPVKVVFSRSEDLRAGNPAPQAVIDLKTGATKDGRLTALKARVVFDAGAYPGGPVLGASNLIGSYYKCPALDIEGFEVLTNKASTGALRAPGTPQVTFAIESQMDVMAEKLGMDRLELRYLNAVEGGDAMPNGRPYPRIGLKECLERLRETDFWKERNTKGHNEGVGIAVGGWLGGTSPASAVATMNPDGTVSIIVGAADITGVNTAFTQIASEELGLPLNRVFVRQSNTASGPYAGISAGSKTARTVGLAVRAASIDLREQLFKLAAERLECSPEDLEAADGRVRVVGSPDKALPFAVLATMTTSMGATRPLLVGRGATGSPAQAPSFTIQGVRVYVDPHTGEVTIKQAICIQDVGLAINPLSVEGQMQGGAAQSIAIGTMEEMQFNEKGIMINPTLLDYRMPTARDLPAIQSIVLEVPAREEDLWGARGVGEASIISGAAAVANAVADATGVHLERMPLTSERILRALGKVKL